MQRAILVLLPVLASLLAVTAPPARAEDVEAWIGEILDPSADQLRRAELLEQVAKVGALDAVARRGLDPSLDVEVVHGVVSALFKHGRFGPHLDQVCRLVLSEPHRTKVLARIEDLGEHPERGRPLVEGLVAIARGEGAAEDDAALRRAAVVALGVIPQRSALETVVQVGLEDREESVRAACRSIASEVLNVETIERARQQLAQYRHYSYYDLIRGAMRSLRREIVRLREIEKRQLERATAAEALEVLAEGDVESRRNASARVRTLAQKGLDNGMSAVEFAKQVLAGFRSVRRSDVQDAETLANLSGALQRLAGGGDEAPLWRAFPDRAVVLQVLAPLARDTGFATSAEERRKVGFAVVRLLDEIGRPAQSLLVEFAADYPHTDVRIEAIQVLGAFARRFEDSGHHVGLKLAQMLRTGERDPAVRRQVLSTLTQKEVPVGEAIPVVRAYLDPANTEGPELSESELKDCVVLLAQAGTPPAYEALVKTSAGHPLASARKFAVEVGLLPWARRHGQEPEILAHLKALALSAEQPEDVRRAVIAGLGEQGSRNALPVLDALVADEDLDAVFREAAADARLRIAERLAGTGDQADLETALGIVAGQPAAGGEARLAQLEKAAREVVKAADGRKVPAGVARWRLAQAFALRQPDKVAEALALYEAAAAKAEADQLGSAQYIALLREYCPLLARRRDDRGAQARAAKWWTKLADLANGNPAEQAAHLLEAVRCALASGDRAQGVALVTRLEAAPLDPQQKAELARLKGEIEKLPEAG